jgi:hypothetical protein
MNVTQTFLLPHMHADLKIGPFGMVLCILMYVTLFQVSLGCFDGLHKEHNQHSFMYTLKRQNIYLQFTEMIEIFENGFQLLAWFWHFHTAMCMLCS